MSSETSTDQSFQPWQFFVLAGLAAATVLVYLEVFVWQSDRASAVLVSLTAGAAALTGYAAWRMVAPLVGSEEAQSPEVVGGRARASLEREKTLVLRSIKELEFDRAMGKLSEEDFAEMGGRLRLRAAGLLRQLDRSTSYRDEIERELAKRLGPDPAAAVRAACASCGTSNDPDARFCKGCGVAVGD
ncbi:MAG: zinc ribbon domain-containing protein [Acidimicrobiia bacterium]|nr:zinc ribbon domain-containing protein [Acidimicrobiia bacterium]